MKLPKPPEFKWAASDANAEGAVFTTKPDLRAMWGMYVPSGLGVKIKDKRFNGLDGIHYWNGSEWLHYESHKEEIDKIEASLDIHFGDVGGSETKLCRDCESNPAMEDSDICQPCILSEYLP